MSRAVTLIGIGEDGCTGLSSRALHAVERAQVLAGGERQLEFFPQFEGQRIVLKGGLSAKLAEIAGLANEHNVCVLASGDPLFFGIGGLLIKKVGAQHVDVLPQPSSMQLAFARAGIAWQNAQWVSLHGRSLFGIATKLKRMRQIACFTDAENTPARIAAHLLEYSEGGLHAWVGEKLGGPGERVRRFASLQELSECTDIDPLNVLILERDDPNWQPAPLLVNYHEDRYAKRVPKKGLITKKEIRLLTLGALAVRESDTIWDIGAASGSVAIECALSAPLGRAYAIEVDPESMSYCRENLKTLGVDNVHPIEGRAPEILSTIEDDPDAVFVGGSKGSLQDILSYSWERLRPGGRLVANAITFENVGEAFAGFRALGLKPEITMAQVNRGAPVGPYTRYDAQNPVHIFSASKPGLL